MTAKPHPRVDAILAELRTLGSKQGLKSKARFAINTDNAFGVSVDKLRALAKPLAPEHELALALWATGNHEARILACFVDDPSAVTEKQMERWVLDFDSWDVCDQATTSLFDLTPFAWQKAVAWAERDPEWVKRAGYALMAGLAVHDRSAKDSAFKKLFPLIVRGAYDPRNFVKKAVNWALRNIGKRNLTLYAAAVACAEQLRDGANERAGSERGGTHEERAARWVAVDALREFASDKVVLRLKAKARKT